jgi:hypothetical protein
MANEEGEYRIMNIECKIMKEKMPFSFRL